VLGLWPACNGLAMALGPTLGGLLIHRFGWRSIFLLVVPPGIAAARLARIAIPESTGAEDRHFDLPAQLLGALVPLDLFRLRPFRNAMVATAGMTFGIYGVLFLLPVPWQGTDHLDPGPEPASR
jgi:MFS family permease